MKFFSGYSIENVTLFLPNTSHILEKKLIIVLHVGILTVCSCHTIGPSLDGPRLINSRCGHEEAIIGFTSKVEDSCKCAGNGTERRIGA